MIRRSPTRIVLKIDDLQEYESMRKEMEAKKGAPTPPAWDNTTKTKQDIVRERIGYVPQPAES